MGQWVDEMKWAAVRWDPFTPTTEAPHVSAGRKGCGIPQGTLRSHGREPVVRGSLVCVIGLDGMQGIRYPTDAMEITRRKEWIRLMPPVPGGLQNVGFGLSKVPLGMFTPLPAPLELVLNASFEFPGHARGSRHKFFPSLDFGDWSQVDLLNTGFPTKTRRIKRGGER